MLLLLLVSSSSSSSAALSPVGVVVSHRRALLATGVAALLKPDIAAAEEEPKFRRLAPIQFIAALGDPEARDGSGAEQWGLWVDDPGPRGVFLRDYATKLKKGKAPAGWEFDSNDWWLEEHGLIMPAPAFPLPPKRYLVTGARKVTTVLTVSPDGKWNLKDGTLYDVTHLPCRSARYAAGADLCSPAAARLRRPLRRRR
ncbi:hypothetical protein CTAYLR_007599 [Chrysophaeum taylorii]|uniref:Uncharacterized protein n=1 Tax=Chrysophaeum taylorii TaxID=2483200 RepID=A0AAD7U6A9_9STRA|nr:hypothetical protein CTAYLR_007599 [Chrysophaeum taylorii]